MWTDNSFIISNIILNLYHIPGFLDHNSRPAGQTNQPTPYGRFKSCSPLGWETRLFTILSASSDARATDRSNYPDLAQKIFFGRHGCNSSHTTINNDDLTSLLAKAHLTGMSAVILVILPLRLLKKHIPVSSTNRDDDRLLRMRLPSKRTTPSTSPMSAMRWEKARTVVNTSPYRIRTEIWLRLYGKGWQVWSSMALYGVRILDSHARNPYHARPITWDVSRGSNLGHGRVANLSWPIGASHGHLWPYVEPELLLMMEFCLDSAAHQCHSGVITAIN
ncbi:uncharacterized protein LACBIDRAFT_331433 [Laccaria bicolor S238N-H82]|uniref:Predicted protein n=1 Tax=Laccaria bicolor (strain S238N-H82 / ATCC MYA-4686) TaxID=486041 RepID=B0DPG6_LACBS|nr:uncharacterized protein LACBIDRAFT_331433 [Laccaria bicolor S238N-H82]EDR03370.1 predicted protein [Laccaria bicolor S238N-H82]|eukprot:XP_001885826.1 predicted protein [Laccaria bicolor S238N-H82]